MDPDSLHTHTTSGLHNVSSYLRLLLASLVFYKTCGFYVVNLFSKGPPPLKKKLCINKLVLAAMMQSQRFMPLLKAYTTPWHPTPLQTLPLSTSGPLSLTQPLSCTKWVLYNCSSTGESLFSAAQTKP